MGENSKLLKLKVVLFMMSRPLASKEAGDFQNARVLSILTGFATMCMRMCIYACVSMAQLVNHSTCDWHDGQSQHL